MVFSEDEVTNFNADIGNNNFKSFCSKAKLLNYWKTQLLNHHKMIIMES